MEEIAWRKSVRSMANGACVEVGMWRKATPSGGSNACVEVAVAEVRAA